MMSQRLAARLLVRGKILVSINKAAIPLATRPFSSDNMSHINATPSYQIYGETAAFTIKAIAPEFRMLGGKTVVLDSSKRGRLLFEWTARNSSTGT
jgi:hypothetical protein